MMKGINMRYLTRFMLLLVALFICAAVGLGQDSNSSQIAPNAPPDKPVQAESQAEADQIEAAIKPYIEKAKQTYPEAKKRFLAGLPSKHGFFVTTRLHDKEGRFEQVFIAVLEIKDGVIKGKIANEITTVSGYKDGDEYSFPESELLDW